MTRFMGVTDEVVSSGSFPTMTNSFCAAKAATHTKADDRSLKRCFYTVVAAAFAQASR